MYNKGVLASGYFIWRHANCLSLVMKTALVFLFLSLLAFSSQAQVVTRAEVVDGDTIPSIYFKQVTVVEKMSPKMRQRLRQESKLIRDVKITMPYAKALAYEMREINETVSVLSTDKEKNSYLKEKEKDLKKRFEGDLKKLTFRQGKLLLKLVDRETGNAAYFLLKEYKNGTSAFFWQGVASIFGMDLKERYDPAKEPVLEAVIAMLGY